MLPGYVAGHYSFEECHIDLGRLARFAGARLIRDEAIGLDRSRALRSVPRPPADPLGFLVARHRLGPARPTMSRVPPSTRSRSSRSPISPARWEALLARAAEDARCCGSRWSAAAPVVSSSRSRRSIGSPALCNGAVEVTLVTREALLPSHNRRVRRLFERIFAERGIVVADRQRDRPCRARRADLRRRRADRFRRGAVGDRGRGRALARRNRDAADR